MAEFDTAWAETWRLVEGDVGLWPAWDPTPAQRDLWREKLAGRDQAAVRAAIRKVASERVGPVPKLGHVLIELRPLQEFRPRSEHGLRHAITDAEYAAVQEDRAAMIGELMDCLVNEPERLIRAARAAQRTIVFRKLGMRSLNPSVEEARYRMVRAGDAYVTENPRPDKWDDMLRGLTWAALRDERRTAKLLGEVQEGRADVLPGADAARPRMLGHSASGVARDAVAGSQPAPDRGAGEDHGRAADTDASELPGDRNVDGPDAPFGELESAAALHAAAGGRAGAVDF